MTHQDFCFWLKGFLDIERMGSDVQITSEQAMMIEKHLQLVFKYEELSEVKIKLPKTLNKNPFGNILPPGINFPTNKYCSSVQGTFEATQTKDPNVLRMSSKTPSTRNGRLC